MQLQQTAADLEGRGIGLAAISYDAPATLKAFAGQHGITFPLLSDAGSETIKRYGLLNTAATGRTAGIPHPGTFVLDARGVVLSRSFEQSYQERASAASLAVETATPNQRAAGRAIDTAHLSVTTSASDAAVAPGTRFSLMADIVPKPRMHVYAPGQAGVIPIGLALAEDPAVKVHAMVFPKPERFFFKPLNETQLVYSAPFRLIQDVTVALTPEMRERARTEGAALTLSGTLRYQACDDEICYLPVDVPVSWTVALRGLVVK